MEAEWLSQGLSKDGKENGLYVWQGIFLSDAAVLPVLG